MTSKMKIDFLLKEELAYELKLRNITFNENTLSVELRKKLRKGISQNVESNPVNLVGKINLKEELETLNCKVNQSLELSKEMNAESRPSDVARLESRLDHCKARLNNVLKFKLSDLEKKDCELLIKNLKLASDQLEELQYDRDSLNQTIRNVNESNLEEERLSDEVESRLDAVTPVLSLNENAPPSQKLGEERSYFDLNLYQKLPNPMENYFKQTKDCNGLNVNDLLEFLKLLFKVKRETNLPDGKIIELFTSKTSGPLQNKMIEYRESSLSALQSVVLKTFVPIGLREKLILEFVNRPQRMDEALALYIESVKMYALILNCNYSERELVEIIKVGINPRDRSNLVFVGSLSSFCDLENACVQSQSVEYNNFLRRKDSHVETDRPKGDNVRKCFNCDRIGHIARQCNRKYNSKN